MPNEQPYYDPALISALTGMYGSNIDWANFFGGVYGPTGEFVPGISYKQYELSQAAFDLNKALSEAGLTGMYGGQPTLASQQFAYQKEQDALANALAQAKLTGYYQGTPTLDLLSLQQAKELGLAEIAGRENIANIQASATLGAAGISASAQVEAAQIRAAADKAIAQMELQARMAEINANKLYQEGTLQIQRGNLELGYAQLNESQRQFDIAQNLRERQFRLDAAVKLAELRANPRDWIALSYLARGQAAPEGTAGLLGPDPAAILEAALAAPMPSPGSGYAAPRITLPYERETSTTKLVTRTGGRSGIPQLPVGGYPPFR